LGCRDAMPGELVHRCRPPRCRRCVVRRGASRAGADGPLPPQRTPAPASRSVTRLPTVDSGCLQLAWLSGPSPGHARPRRDGQPPPRSHGRGPEGSPSVRWSRRVVMVARRLKENTAPCVASRRAAYPALRATRVPGRRDVGSEGTQAFPTVAGARECTPVIARHRARAGTPAAVRCTVHSADTVYERVRRSPRPVPHDIRPALAGKNLTPNDIL